MLARADGQLTVADLNEFCISKDFAVHNACKFYILGIFEGTQIAAGMLCVPEDLPASAMETAIRLKMGQDLAMFPADAKMPAASFVGAVIAKQFPCRQK